MIIFHSSKKGKKKPVKGYEAKETTEQAHKDIIKVNTNYKIS